MEELPIRGEFERTVYVTLSSVENVQHGFGHAVKAQYRLVSRRPSHPETISDNRHSKKGNFAIVFEFHCETE